MLCNSTVHSLRVRFVFKFAWGCHDPTAFVPTTVPAMHFCFSTGSDDICPAKKYLKPDEVSADHAMTDLWLESGVINEERKIVGTEAQFDR